MGVRSNAFEIVQRRPTAWSEPSMATALLRLLEREDDLIASTLRESNGAVAAGDKYGEWYSEYHGELQVACLTYCDKDGLLTLLLRNASNGSEVQSTAVDVLGVVRRYGFNLRQRLRMDSALIVSAAYPRSFMIREAALRALHVSIDDGDLPDNARQRIHTAVVLAVTDPDFRVRRSAVGMLPEFGDKADFDLIRQAAAGDTAAVMSKGRLTYPVRETATRALARLKVP
jgi:hypothetical protein